MNTFEWAFWVLWLGLVWVCRGDTLMAIYVKGIEEHPA